MPIDIILHIRNVDPILAEIDELPNPDDQILIVRNPRFRDGRDIHFIERDVKTVIWPLKELTLIEVLTDEQKEDIIGFVRE
jgi:hypothetical protein